MKNIKSNLIKNIFGFLFFLMGPRQVGALGSCPSCLAPGPGLDMLHLYHPTLVQKDRNRDGSGSERGQGV